MQKLNLDEEKINVLKEAGLDVTEEYHLEDVLKVLPKTSNTQHRENPLVIDVTQCRIGYRFLVKNELLAPTWYMSCSFGEEDNKYSYENVNDAAVALLLWTLGFQ